jgi:hypothetical protein
MSFDPISAVFDLGKTAIEKIWPDANKRSEEIRKLEELRAKGRLEELAARVSLLTGQMQINQEEAKHKSIFVAGWRPAVGWVCVSILAFNYIGVYLLEYAASIFEVVKPPERMDMTELWPVLLGMLGIAATRSYDKKQGTQTDKI